MRLQSGGARLLAALVMAIVSLVSYFAHSSYNSVTQEKQHVGMTVRQEVALGDQTALLASVSTGRTPEFFSTHPNPEHRVQRIEEAIHAVYPNGVPAGLEP